MVNFINLHGNQYKQYINKNRGESFETDNDLRQVSGLSSIGFINIGGEFTVKIG